VNSLEKNAKSDGQFNLMPALCEEEYQVTNIGAPKEK
jgi:hypothetical protein